MTDFEREREAVAKQIERGILSVPDDMGEAVAAMVRATQTPAGLSAFRAWLRAEDQPIDWLTGERVAATDAA